MLDLLAVSCPNQNAPCDMIFYIPAGAGLFSTRWLESKG
jgi:hypothetical protein